VVRKNVSNLASRKLSIRTAETTVTGLEKLAYRHSVDRSVTNAGSREGKVRRCEGTSLVSNQSVM
jgi:hypothetical protein